MDFLATVIERLTDDPWGPAREFWNAYVDYDPTAPWDARPEPLVTRLRRASASVRGARPGNAREFAAKIRIGCAVGASALEKKSPASGEQVKGFLCRHVELSDAFFLTVLHTCEYGDLADQADEALSADELTGIDQWACHALLLQSGPIWLASIHADLARLDTPCGCLTRNRYGCQGRRGAMLARLPAKPPQSASPVTA